MFYESLLIFLFKRNHVCISFNSSLVVVSLRGAIGAIAPSCKMRVDLFAIIFCIYRLFILRFRLRNSDHELIPVSVCIRKIKRKRLQVKKEYLSFLLEKPDLRPVRRPYIHSNNDIDI